MRMTVCTRRSFLLPGDEAKTDADRLIQTQHTVCVIFYLLKSMI